MSCQEELRKMYLEKNNCKYNSEKLIVYIDKQNSEERERLMKKGYEDMAILNLKLAIMTDHELDDVNDYETWLCGE
ncbi:CopG family transcriptional regulator/antitoxin EndoAI [Clostridium moniliforme]|uniref:CopG family transcriptional regulator/antitoxin EndoAI n=1 Tax=Clostridium moniliforme TaxID=39489 RepID=A0ABS4F2F9_9CLOT|nr:hypothetical protein [Clostridium moniliforme]MBP1890424.1 CopG family transcriptional regulator/antitoxin EndoAI [Clostridium moniliforme]